MRYRLVIFFCIISVSASAQWWRLNFKKHPVFSELKAPRSVSYVRISATPQINTVQVQPVVFGPTILDLEAREKVIMKLVKHNMSWRIYNAASYNFSDLAHVYIQMHRLSEAKWYLLQSNAISRDENDDKHTIANLISLAHVKTWIGDKVSAHADLCEALDLAKARSMQPEIAEVEKNMSMLDQYKANTGKPDIKYAETPDEAKNSF
ncbi:MAG: hypothetical protein JST19_00820 [Bacteroidetes bacterium]|nr:hypothetical protein [Bacteroidota bacterium]